MPDIVQERVKMSDITPKNSKKRCKMSDIERFKEVKQ